MLDLLDYRRQVSVLYSAIRQLGSNSPDAFQHFQAERDVLFAQHPSSALSNDQKATFKGLHYQTYDERFRIVTEVHPITEGRAYRDNEVESGTFQMRPFGTVHLDLPTGQGDLTLYWIMGYGGGVFLPFRDMTNGVTTYGGGRYLLDTIKGADLGSADGRVVLDFNYAYHPSCAYNPRWVCPLSPPENRLTFPIPVGEQLAMA